MLQSIISFLCFSFFSIWLFSGEYSRLTRQQVKGETIALYPFYNSHPLRRHLDISWVIAAESSPLRITGSRNRTWNLCDTLFRIHSFRTWTGRKMIKTWVTLGNISLVLLNLTKRLIFVIFKDSSSLSIFTKLTIIFSL